MAAAVETKEVEGPITGTFTTAIEEELTKKIVAVDVVDVKPNSTFSELEYLVVTAKSDGTQLSVWRTYDAFALLDSELRTTSKLVDDIVFPTPRWFDMTLPKVTGGAAARAAAKAASESVVPPATADDDDMESASSEGSDAGDRAALQVLFDSGALHADSVDLRKALLDNYMKDLLSVGAGDAAEFRGFATPPLRADWPGHLGPIDLWVHDRPHASSYTEWWYMNTHFKDSDGKDYSAFVCFFRIIKHIDRESGKKYYAHALNWAITDVENKVYVQETIVDKDTPALLKEQLQDDSVISDPRLRRAYMEIVAKGNVPLPDRMFKREPVCRTDRLEMSFESASLTKDDAGRYLLKATKPDGQTAVDLVLTPEKPAVRHGLNGVVKGHDGDDMFYYLIPRCGLTGSFTLGGVTKPIASGQGWYDHEFGGYRKDGAVSTPLDYAWNWAAIQLDNGYEVSVATLIDPRAKPQRIMERRTIVIDPSGRRAQPDDLEFEGVSWWSSLRTFNEYPTVWSVKLPSMGIDLTLEAPVADQEFITLIAKPGFWEGRVAVSGTMGGASVTGVGYVERNGFTPLTELGGFFKKVGKKTRAAVRDAYPDNPTEEQVAFLISSPDTPHYMEGVPCDKIYDNLIKPVRHISDRGGKSWRSYGALACVDIVGGDCRQFPAWLAMPEFMHVGSLIIDDIQDRSTVRRGTKCCHLVFGDGVAINAGTAAYFQCQQLLKDDRISHSDQCRVYDYYFAALRGGHAGQALDMEGLDYLMDDCITRRDSKLPESRILAVHRLKTAVPAGALARMGALLGKGSEAQIEAVGRYFESVGVAFQIMDDVLNLRGLYTNEADRVKNIRLKNLGEDITAGKVTIPVVKAIDLLPMEEMQGLWDVIRTHPADTEVVAECIATLERCGAIEACVDQAVSLVEDAWRVLDPIVPDSFSKIMLRSFGWFVTERHY